MESLNLCLCSQTCLSSGTCSGLEVNSKGITSWEGPDSNAEQFKVKELFFDQFNL